MPHSPRRLVRALVLSFLPCLSACAIGLGPYPADGLLFSSYKGPVQVVPGKAKAGKVGESCAHTILGLITIGDASIEAAKTKGAIKRVAMVDYSRLSVLMFLYGQTCAQVKGE